MINNNNFSNKTRINYYLFRFWGINYSKKIIGLKGIILILDL